MAVIRSRLRMPRPDSPDPHDPFQAFLQRVTRPIEFASRDAYAHLKAVRNLDRFVSEQVIGALGERVYSQSLETELLSLRNLFVDFHTRLSPIEQQDRLSQALGLLRRLQEKQHKINPPDTSPSKGRSVPGLVRSGSTRVLWDLPIQFAKGVGPHRTMLLERLGIHTIEQALWTLPWRYEDRSVVTPVNKLVPGSMHIICGVIVCAEATRAGSRRLSILDVAVEDTTGTVRAVFFNQPYLEDVLKRGVRIMMAGRVVAGRGGWMDVRLEATQFEVLSGAEDELLHVGRIVPIYHETKGWTSRHMRVLIHGLLTEYETDVEEVLPLSVRARHRLPPISVAIRQVHFPPPKTDLPALDRGTTAAHRRLAFEELFLLQAALVLRQRETKEELKPFRFNPNVAQ
nr:hypothetical protein [Nitrospira sp.]